MPPKRTYRKKRSFRKRRKNNSGLTKKEKQEVVSIIDKKAESKYFNTTYNLQGQSFKYQSATADNQEVVVRGFALGDAKINGVYGTYGYDYDDNAARQITAINSARTFQEGESEEAYEAYLPDGRYVSPSLCRCVWRVHRDMIDDVDANNIRKGNPYLVRMIRVKPRALKYSGATIVPSTDLFLNLYGFEYGVDSAPSNYTKNFGAFELQTAKVNTRKYEVIQDIQFELKPPSVSTVLNMDYITTEVNSQSQKLITTTHKLPAKLHYNGAFINAVNIQPTSPQSNELVLFHCAILGITQKSQQPNLKIDCKPVSTFKDM